MCPSKYIKLIDYIYIFLHFGIDIHVQLCILVGDLICQVATRAAYGTALVKIGKNNDRVVAMDGDTKNSTFSIKFKVSQDFHNFC